MTIHLLFYQVIDDAEILSVHSTKRKAEAARRRLSHRKQQNVSIESFKVDPKKKVA
jgi:hypothetical protein